MAHHAKLGSVTQLPGKLTRYQSVRGTPETLLPQPVVEEGLGAAQSITGPTYRQSAIQQTVFVVSLCLGVVAAPFHQTDWPVPRAEARPVTDWIAGTPYALTAVVAPEVNPLGAPVSVEGPQFSLRLRQDQVSSSPYALTAVVAPPFHQTDWPNPRGDEPVVASWQDNFKLPLTTHKGTAQYDWPVPKGKQRHQDWIAGSPYALTTVVVVAKPFAQTDWQVPRGKRRTDYGWTWNTFLQIQDTPFQPVTDYKFLEQSRSISTTGPNIVLGYQFPEINPLGAPTELHGPTFRWRNQDWIAGSPYALTSEEVVVAGPRSARISNPLALSRTQDWIFSSPYALTAVVVVAAPFRQTDWPVPKGYAPRQAWSDSFKPPLTTHKGKAQYDWPNPRGYRRNEQLGWTQEGLARTTVVVYPATFHFDWPNPRGALPLNRGWSDSFKLPLTTHKGTAQYDWPVPKGPKRNEQLGWFNEGLARTTVVVYPAKITFDWPNPRGPQPLNRGFSDSFKLPLTTHKPPFTQYDWPIPKGKKSNQPLSWSDSLELPLVFIRPFSQTDWPIPKGAKPKVTDWILGTPYPLTFVAPVPFVQRNWPNPLGKIPATTLKTWSDSFKLPLTTHRPHRQHDWPVPKGKLPSVSVKTWTDSFKLPLTTVKPPFTQYDWPVPKGAKPNQPISWMIGATIHLEFVVPTGALTPVECVRVAPENCRVTFGKARTSDKTSKRTAFGKARTPDKGSKRTC